MVSDRSPEHLRRASRGWLLTAALLCGSSIASAQDSVDTPRISFAEAAAQLMAADPAVRDAYKTYLLAQIDRDTRIISEREGTIGWTNGVSRFMFIVVHGILAFGLWAARREFLHAQRTRTKNREQHEVNISLEGIALKTSLQGILLLGFALGFYFLYLRFVYPITSVA